MVKMGRFAVGSGKGRRSAGKWGISVGGGDGQICGRSAGEGGDRPDIGEGDV
jgi:hypothetical protein